MECESMSAFTGWCSSLKHGTQVIIPLAGDPDLSSHVRMAVTPSWTNWVTSFLDCAQLGERAWSHGGCQWPHTCLPVQVTQRPLRFFVRENPATQQSARGEVGYCFGRCICLDSMKIVDIFQLLGSLSGLALRGQSGVAF